MSLIGLRRAVGILGLALPVVLAVGKIWLDGGGIQGTISGYYYTVMREYFVASTCLTGAFLLCYRDGRAASYLSTALGAFSVGLALFPTSAGATSQSTGEAVVALVHLICSTLFFVGQACFCLFLFTRPDPGVLPRPQSRRRNTLCRACGLTVLLCLVLIVVVNLVLTETVRDVLHPVFWLESLAVWAYSVSWLVKGDLLLRSPVHL